MPSYRDIELLNQSMRGLGDSFAQRREEETRNKQLAIEEELRRKNLDLNERQVASTEAANKAEAAGKIEAWIAGENGAPVRFTGSQKGLNDLITGAQQQGKVLKIVDRPDQTRRRPFKITSELPVGTVEYELDTVEDLQKAVEALKSSGGRSPAKSPGQSRSVANIEMARKYRELAAQSDNPDEQERLLRYAEALEQAAEKEGQPVVTQTTQNLAGTAKTSVRGTPQQVGAIGGQPRPQAGGTKENPATPKSRAEAEALPPGTWFKDPAGNIIQKK